MNNPIVWGDHCPGGAPSHDGAAVYFGATDDIDCHDRTRLGGRRPTGGWSLRAPARA